MEIRPIVVYLIEQHPLETASNSRFRWLADGENRQQYLEAFLGNYDPDNLSLMIDKHPAGPAWREMLRGLIDEKVKMVITHLAPLSSAQRQLLIGLCADSGAQLITPGDGGRNNQNARVQNSI